MRNAKMSRAVFNQIKILGSRYNYLISNSFWNKTFCSSTSNNNSNEPFGQSTILVQQGCNIQELPVIVRKLGQDEFIALCCDKVPDSNNVGGGCPNKNSDDGEENKIVMKSCINLDEVLKNIDNCMTTNGILLLIDSISDLDLTSDIALQAINKITRIETLVTLRNIEGSKVFQRLIKCIVDKGTNTLLLNVLGGLKAYLDLDQTIQFICNELIKRSTDNKLNLEETCEAIHRFVDVKRNISAEQFWSSLVYQEKQITHKNICYVYSVLPHIKMSRRTLISTIEKKITTMWWQISTEAAIEILTALDQCSMPAFRTMMSLSRWTNTNIHALDEASLESVIEGFTNLNHTDSQIERAIERYIKAKGVKIKSQSLIVALLAHCAKFRLRNHHILNGCSEYFISNIENIEPGYLKSIVCPFGYLNYQPLNAIRFWQTLEYFIETHFIKIEPNNLVDMMLACVYLEIYPINFVRRIFNPYFLDVLHSTNSPERLQKIRSDLKLFDTSLSLECSAYNGPLLPKDMHAKSVSQDGRIKRIINHISNELADIAGGPECMSKSVILYQFPVNDLYIVDVLFHPKGMSNIWTFNVKNERNIHIAVLIHLPEHYNSTGEHLIGPQAMRIRHFRKMGMRVVTLQYDKLSRLRVYPKDLNKYLVSRMKEALPAMPEE